MKFGNYKLMSRIGKKPIEIPEPVKIEIKDRIVKIKGPKGELEREIPADILVEQKDKEIVVSMKR